ncbi:MAG: hypothetical protein HC902_07695 [Calothrix sp. SM1_5_4]|nr:hypothetical protein [Calothrix sp. SM1_5_4]
MRSALLDRYYRLVHDRLLRRLELAGLAPRYCEVAEENGFTFVNYMNYRRCDRLITERTSTGFSRRTGLAHREVPLRVGRAGSDEELP